jgi:hypothetical protein
MFSDVRHRAANRSHGKRLKTKRHTAAKPGANSSDSLKERHA